MGQYVGIVMAPPSDELAHFGIHGMKWGIRRYQNADGSLTPEGRKRYMNDDGTLNAKGKKRFGDTVGSEAKRKYTNEERADIARTGKVEKIAKRSDEFTDEEIKQAIARYDLNKALNTRISEVNQSQKDTGENFVQKTVKMLGTAADGAASAAKLIEQGTNAYNSYVTVHNSMFEEKLKPISKPEKIQVQRTISGRTKDNEQVKDVWTESMYKEDYKHKDFVGNDGKPTEADVEDIIEKVLKRMN